MGYPNIPDISPDILIDREEVINLLLASIGLEELSLAHLVNAEAEKLQRALGTLVDDAGIPIGDPMVETLEELLMVNRDVAKVLKLAMHKEFILLTKLEDVIDFAEEFPPGPTTTPTVTPPPILECPCSVRVTGNNIFDVTVLIDGQPATGQVNVALISVCNNCNLTNPVANFNFEGQQGEQEITLTFNQLDLVDLTCSPEDEPTSATITGIWNVQGIGEATGTVTVDEEGNFIVNLAITSDDPEAPTSFVINPGVITELSNVVIEDCDED